MSKRKMTSKRTNNANWRLAALLPLGAALNGMAMAADQPTKAQAAEKKEITLPAVKVKATRDNKSGNYKVGSSTAGTKTDTPLIETPQSISVITSDQMEAQNVSTMAEALRYTPGVQSETFGFEPRTTFIKIRGFDATETGLYRDGLKLSNPGFAVGYSLEPYGAERVEVPRGPASVLYGQASPGGLVNYVSKRPTFDPFREIKFEAGTYDRFQGELDVGGALDERKTLAYRVTGLVRGSETQVDYINDNRIYVAPALTWKPGDDTTLTFLSHYQKDDTKPSQRLPAEGTLRTNANGKIPTNRFTGEPNVDQYRREEFAVGYALEHRVNDAVTLRQNTRYYNNEVDDRSIYTTALLADQRTTSRALYESFGKVHGFNLDNQAQFKFSTSVLDHALLSGLDFQHVGSNSLQTYGAAPNLDIFNPVYGSTVASAPVFKNEDVTQNQIGLYLQDQIKFGEHWRATLGGRYDRADSVTKNKLTGLSTTQDDNALTGRAGLVYVADNGLAPYFSYAQSFLPALGTDAAGKALKPETGEQYEFGVKFQPKNQNSFVTLAYFDLTRTDFLTPDPITYANVQRGEANSRGVELEGVASLDNGLNLTANYTYLNAEVTKSSFAAEVGEPLEYTPEHKASAWADYTVPTGIAKGWGVGGGARYIGTSFGNSYAAKNTIEVPGTVLFDASTHYNWKQFQFSVNLQNALDKEYVATAFTSGGAFATFGPKRVVTGSIKYSF
ncbi:TonB-dependent siderophore receptor [Methylobacter tundripaludum]|uniref:TonB-dependent siderophore receptor n=1 Tax=Methylobacter tundripaludum TaxID=173365 RepID=UPI000AE72E96|nr:TonB-dependent siderophore receptor [Methylobacter tundripaludum]